MENKYFYEIDTRAVSDKTGNGKGFQVFIAPSQVGGRSRDELEQYIADRILDEYWDKFEKAGARKVEMRFKKHAFWKYSETGWEDISTSKMSNAPFTLKGDKGDIDKFVEDIAKGLDILVEWLEDEDWQI